MNPMELYHNQVTRAQGPFSLRMFHRSWGLMLIQANIEAPCTLLDFPTLDRFIEEIRTTQYDIIGISVDHSELGQGEEDVRADPRSISRRRRSSSAGTSPTCPTWPSEIDADHIVRGEGVRWFRSFLGEDAEQPIRHPLITSGSARATMGVSAERAPRRRGRHGHPVGRLPAGLQLLLHLGHVRRQGKVRQLLPDRRRAVRHHVPARDAHEGPLVLRDGRELPAPPQAGPAAAGTDGAARQGLGALRVQLGQRAPLVHASTNSSAGHLLGVDGHGGQEQPVHQAQRASTPSPWSASCSRTASACSARRSSAWRTTRRRTSTRRSSTPSGTTPTSTSSCSTRRSPARRCTPS